jgi:serine/threonine-protein kinase RsbT
MATQSALGSITKTETLTLTLEQDVVLARQLVRRVTQELGFGLVDQTKIVTATSELARNAVIHGLGGTLVCELLTDGVRNGLRLHFVDQGPGIQNLELAMTDGWTSGQGMGLGLSGARRLVNDFAITSAPGQGTTVTICRWK